MNKAREYRCRITGETITKQDIPGRTAVTRNKPPKVMQHGKLVQPEWFAIVPPADESLYDDFLFDLADIDPILPTPKPDFNPEFFKLKKLPAVKRGGVWKQAWETEHIYDTLDKQREAAVRRVKRLQKELRDGGIEVGGVQVKTDADGRSLLLGASMRSRPKRKFTVGDKEFDLTDAKIDAMVDAVEDHIQKTYDDRAKIVKQIMASDDPYSVDVSSLENEQ